MKMIWDGRVFEKLKEWNSILLWLVENELDRVVREVRE